jgi:cell division protein FtsQ
MSFALTKQKGPAAAVWDYFRPNRNKRRKRRTTLSNKSPNKSKISTWARTMTELGSKLFLAGVIGYLLFAGYNFLISTPRFQIQNVTFKGNHVLNNSQLFEWLGPVIGENLISIDLVRLNKRLSEHPWVQTVSIQRIFPQGLEFELIERVPYARIKKDQTYLIDNLGFILSPEKAGYGNLPLILLNESKEQGVSNGELLKSLKTMDDFNQLSFFKNNPLEVVELVGPSRVVFKAGKEGFKIQMSRDELNEGFKNFKIIQDSLEDENLEIQLIDLSFKDQIVIREKNQVQH